MATLNKADPMGGLKKSNKSQASISFAIQRALGTDRDESELLLDNLQIKFASSSSVVPVAGFTARSEFCLSEWLIQFRHLAPLISVNFGSLLAPFNNKKKRTSARCGSELFANRADHDFWRLVRKIEGLPKVSRHDDLNQSRKADTWRSAQTVMRSIIRHPTPQVD